MHVEQVGLWESVSAVVADEVRQTSARETTRALIVGATEGAFPVEIDLIPPYADWGKQESGKLTHGPLQAKPESSKHSAQVLQHRHGIPRFY